METITLDDLLTATSGTLVGPFCDRSVCIFGAQSDNRVIGNQEVFFAFPGERADGHRFVDAALEAGACGAVIEKELSSYRPDRFYVMVEDTIKAYGDLARFYRRRFSMPVVGITGSVGKTTTKDMVSSVLSQHFKTTKTQGNFNNNIGLPRTVLTLEQDTGAAVIEMGMNHRGEIAYLTRIARPDIAVITNIGEAHIGNLGSKENIFRAKCEILEGLKEGGLLVLNGDDGYLCRIREDQEVTSRFRIVFAGESVNCDYRALFVDDSLGNELCFEAQTPNGTFPLTIPSPSRHMLYSALMAAAVGEELGLCTEEIQRGVASYVPTKMRMEILHPSDSVILYNDTYNANPQSMKAGLLTLSKTLPENTHLRRIAVVGDMFELGDLEETLHREVGAYAAGLSLDTLVCVGSACEYLADEAKKCGQTDTRYCRDKEEAKSILQELTGPDTAWLFKASRGMALEELADFVKEKSVGV